MNLQASVTIPRRPKDGETGDGIVNTVISYAKSESGTTPPSTGWASTLPTPTQGWYLWTRTVTTYRIRPATTTYSVSRYGEDGTPGLPGQIPVRKEWVAGDTHRNNDTVIDYLYVRGATKGLSYWYKPLSTINEAQAPPQGGVSRVGYKRIDSNDELAVDVLLAEEANVAGFIFKGGQLISQVGSNTAGDKINIGEYMQFQFARGASLSTAPTTGWADTPPTSSVTYLWMRMKLKSNTGWMVNYRISGSNPHVGVRFGAIKDGTFYNIPYQSGRDWIEITYDAGTGNEQVRIYPITEELAISDFKPNLQLDGRNGYIYATRGEFEGVVKADSGSIGKWEIIGESITSPNKRLILDSLSNAMSMLDEYGATKVLIKPEPISSLNDYFAGGSGGSIDISSLMRVYSNSGSSSASSPTVNISTSGGKVYEAIIPAFRISVNVDVLPMGDGTTQPMGVVANLIVYFRTSLTTKVEIGRASVMSVGGFEAETVQVASSTRPITKDGDYSLQVVLEVTNPSGQIVSASGNFSSDTTTIPINQIVNRSEIGTNGMVIATSPTSYTYMGGSEFATRKGNYGIRITSSGIQKMTNGSWGPANI